MSGLVNLSLEVAINTKDKDIISLLLVLDTVESDVERELTLKGSITKRDIRQMSKGARVQLRDFMRRHNIEVAYGVGQHILPALLEQFPDGNDDEDALPAQPPKSPAPSIDVAELVSLLRGTTTGNQPQGQQTTLPAAPITAVSPPIPAVPPAIAQYPPAVQVAQAPQGPQPAPVSPGRAPPAQVAPVPQPVHGAISQSGRQLQSPRRQPPAKRATTYFRSMPSLRTHRPDN